MTATQSGFGEWLRRHRLAAGLSQEELAERAGLSARGISDLERGIRRKPQRETVRLLAEALKLPDREWRPFDTAVDRRRGRVQEAGTDAAVAHASSSGIPVSPTPLVGRQREVGWVRRMLLDPDIRLVTLTGAGGTGKTRLALRVASELADAFPDGVHFVPLASITDPALVAMEVARPLGLVESGERSPRDRLRELMRDRRLLLVLDNFEQVLDAGELVADLLASSPGLVVLVTSRAVLRLSGEHEYPVPPLAIPDAGSSPPPDELARYGAVRLFVQRARSVRPDFALTEANAPAVAAICRRLDGLPLAIELAAARTKLLPPQAMLQRLERTLGFLTGGARDLPERQRTMRAAIDWSYELLGECERRLLARLGVFSGGCTLEAMEAVCGGEDEQDSGILDLLEELVDNSLLLQEAKEGDEPRFRMLETVREYALERLEQSGEAEQIRRRHARFYLELAERTESELGRGVAQLEWRDRLEVEHGNLGAALEWCAQRGEWVTSYRLAGAISRFWWTHGYLAEGRRWLEAALSIGSTASDAARTNVLYSLGVLLEEQVDPQWTHEIYKRSLELVGGAGGRAAAMQSDFAWAAALLEESIALRRRLGDTSGVIGALLSLGWTYYKCGDERAQGRFEESLALCRGQGDQVGAGDSLIGLGCLAILAGEYPRGAAHLQKALQLSRAAGYPVGVVHALYNLGWEALARGDYPRAEAYYRESLECFHSESDMHGIVLVLEGLAALAGAQGHATRAARLLGAAAALREDIGAPIPPHDRARYEGHWDSARLQLGEEFEAMCEDGRVMSVDDAICYALEVV